MRNLGFINDYNIEYYLVLNVYISIFYKLYHCTYICNYYFGTIRGVITILLDDDFFRTPILPLFSTLKGED